MSRVTAGEDKPAKIGQKLFREAVAALDAAPILRRIAEIGDADRCCEELSGRVMRAGGLIHERPNRRRQTRRDRFLAQIRAALVDATEDRMASFDVAVDTIGHVEEGCARILETRARCDFVSLDLPTRIGALLERAQGEMRHLHQAIGRQVEVHGMPAIGGSMLVERDGAGPIAPEAVHSSLVRSLGGALKLEGYAGKLFDGDGRLVLPEPAEADDDALHAIGSELTLGMIWLQWGHLHSTARHLGDGVVRTVELAQIGPEGEGGEPGTREVDLLTRKQNANMIDFLANERSLQRENLSTGRMLLERDFDERARGIGGSVPLLPAAWVSAAEVGHAVALSEALGYEVATDEERPGGLRLVQWLRCYAAVAELASSREAETGFLSATRDELVELLGRMSIGEEDAGTFLTAVSFGRTSRDLHDAPLVATHGGFLLAGPGLADQRLARIIPSLLASRGVELKRKGEAFEARVLEFLRRQGIDAQPVKHVDPVEGEYQYDALARWEDHVLLVECKNRSLSDNDPATAYHRVSQTAEDIGQVHRLLKGLNDNPQILTSRFGEDAASLPVIPIVLHNETWQLRGAIEGVYVHDWSALTRFFERPTYHATRLHRINGKTIANQVAIASLWEGERPTPDDLMRQLEDPIQTRIEEAHVHLVPHDFALDAETAARDWFLRLEPKTEESMCEALGVDPGPVLEQLDRQGEQIEALRSADALGQDALALHRP